MVFRHHPYILAAIIATVLAIGVWMVVPKEYSSKTKVSDEYKEVDLALGMNPLHATIRNNLGLGDDGINNLFVYCQILKTDDFARRILGNVKIQGRPLAEHLNTDNPVAEVKSNIEYNASTLQQTLIIQYTDKDPYVAAAVLDSITKELQRTISDSRHKMSLSQMANVKIERDNAKKAYDAAHLKWAEYVDSHSGTLLKEENLQIKKLEDEVNRTRSRYDEYSKIYTRYYALLNRSYCSFSTIEPITVPTKDTSHPFAYIAVFVLIAIVLVKAFKLYEERRGSDFKLEWGGLFSPWSITILVWGGMAVMLSVTSNLLDPLTNQFYISITLWISIFLVTSFSTFNLLEHRTQPVPTSGIEVNKYIYNFLFVASFVLTILFAYKVYKIVSMFDAKDIMSNAREFAVFGDSMGFLNYASVITQAILLVSLWRYPRMPLWQLLVVIFCCLVNSLAAMEKGGFFLVFICGMYVMFERGVVKLRTIFLSGLILIGFFYLFNLMRSGEDSEYSKNETILDFIGMYVMSPPVAYCRLMPDLTGQFGTNTFAIVYNFLARFGFPVEVHEKLQEFVFVPITTNVYTIMQPFYRDFGHLGVAFFAGVYGIVSGWVYRLSKNGNLIAICAYTYLMQVLVLQFYQENIFYNLVVTLQKLFFVFLIVQTGIRLNCKRKQIPVVTHE